MKSNHNKSEQKILFALSVFCILLTIIFLWNEIDSFDLSRKANSEKIAAYFTVLGASVAGVSLYLLSRQLMVLNLSNELISKPDLYPSFTEFEVKDEIAFSLSESNNKPIIRVFRLEGNKLTTPYIELFNIGNGSAKSINIKWHYDISKVDLIIKEVYNYKEISSTEEETIDFLQEKGKIPINIPFHYFICCGQQLNSDILDRIELQSEKLKPELKLLISYQDIQNKWNKKSFNINVSAYDSSVHLKFVTE